VRVRDLLDVPGLGLRLLTDVAGMDRTIRHVHTTDLPDPSRYLTRGDLVLTGLIWCREPGDADRFGVGGEPRITSWFLACAGREQDWPHELRESVALPRMTRSRTIPPRPRPPTCSRPGSAWRSRSSSRTAPGSGSGSWNACAAKMYVHVNTVRYRIRRIEELTGRDLSCLDDQVDFFLALKIR